MYRHVSSRRKTIISTGLVCVGLLVLLVWANASIIGAAPASQGTVPLPPTPTITATPALAPLLAPSGACCLPGVAFQSNRDGNLEIYVMSYDGSHLTRVTLNPATDMRPGPSADGTKIAFASTRDDPDPTTCGQPGKPSCVIHIYSMNVDGTGLTRLTDGSFQDNTPFWSNGGTTIAFVSNRNDPDPKTCGQQGKPDCVLNVYVMNANGTGITRLTTNPASSPNASNFDPNWSPDDTQIVFTSNRDGNDELYAVNFNGTGLVRLTNNAAKDGHGAWSPDGSRLVFESNRDGKFQLYVTGADGTGTTRLTNIAADDVHPIWLPGCSDRIVFASNRDGAAFRIFSIDPDGTNITRLTSAPQSGPAQDDYPAWSGLPASISVTGPCCVPGVAFHSLRDGPNEEIYIMRADGSRQTRLTFNTARDMNPAPSPKGVQIAFQSNRDGLFQIYVMNYDGSGQTRLLTSNANDTDPAWSTDNSKIAFVSTRDDPNPQTCGQNCVKNIYVMNANGSGLTRLTNSTSGVNTLPSWSTDSKKIAFVSNRDGNDEIYVMNADGTGLVRLTNNPAVDGHPTWSNDSKQIAFDTNRDGNNQIYVMNADGSNLKRLTNNKAQDRKPYWCPTCTDRIAFVSDRDGVNLIYTMAVLDSNQVRLTTQLPGVTGQDDAPAWSGLPPVKVTAPVALPVLGVPAPTATPTK